jgi:polar amino acid transport system permease protein
MEYRFRFNALAPYTDEILGGVLLTLQLSVVTMLIGLAIGVVVAAMRTGRVPVLRAAAATYVEAIRNTPLLVQLFIIFFGLPALGLRMTANEAAVVGLSVNVGAYLAEIVRAGIQSVHRSQVEAGLSLGLNPLQVLRHVVLFPAFKATYPALTSQFVLLMLATSIVSTIGATELFHVASFIDSRTFRSFEVYAVITLVYLALTILFRGGFAALYWLIFVRRPRPMNAAPMPR